MEHKNKIEDDDTEAIAYVRGEGEIPDFFRYALNTFDFQENLMRKPKIFIVEGPDGTGKTTMCNILSKLHNIPIVHLTYFEKQTDMEQQYKRVFQLIYSLGTENNENGIIFDRFIASNIVYSQVYKNSKESPWIHKIELLLATICNIIDVTFISCLPADKQDYLNHYKDIASNRDELYGDDIEKMGKVYDVYKAVFEAEKNILYHKDIKWIDYDYLKEAETIQMKDLLEEF